MANRRMIASDIWRDDFVCSLDYFQRLLWIGMVVTCADDQGRLQDRAGFIASDVFPGEMLSYKIIEDALSHFQSEGKIVRYLDGKVKLIQIVNWWGYQSPAWAMPSKYLPPDGWVDRVKMHAKDNKVHTMNWEEKGGYKEGVPPVHTEGEPVVHTPIEDVKSSRGLNDGDGESSSSGEPQDDSDIITFCEITHLPIPAVKAIRDAWQEQLTALKEKGVTENIMRRACKELTEKGTYRITSPKSIAKACEVVLAEKQRKAGDGYVPIGSNPEYAGVVNR